MVDHLDFVAAWSGETEHLSADGSQRVVETSARRVALGDTKILRYEIDLYLWLDVPRASLAGRSATPFGERAGQPVLSRVRNPWRGLPPPDGA